MQKTSKAIRAFAVVLAMALSAWLAVSVVPAFGGDGDIELPEIPLHPTTDISTAEVASIDPQTFNGSAITPAPTVTLGGKTLAKGTDYTLSYENNTNAGIATIIVIGRGSYAGRVPKTFTIEQAPVTVKANDASKDFGLSDPTFTATVTGTFGSDKVAYTLSRDPGESVGSYAIHATGEASQGNYTVTFRDGTLLIAGAVIPDADVDRIAGDTAMQTAVAISRKTFDKADCAVIARADGFSDALAASAFAGAMECPILLAYRDNAYNGCVAGELVRLGVSTIYIAGGEAAVSEDTADYLAAACGAVIERVDGSSLGGYQGYAIDTALDFAVRVAKLTASGDFLTPKDVIIVTQRSFMDALSMSPFAYATASPVIMLNWDLTLDERSRAIIDAFDGTVYVAGGTAAVPEESAEAIYGSADEGGRVVRLADDTGFDTSLVIAKYLVENSLASPACVCVASGAPEGNGVDALAGAALAGRAGGVMLLAGYTPGTFDYCTAVEDFLGEYASQVEKAYVLGGTFALTDDYLNAVKGLLKK